MSEPAFEIPPGETPPGDRRPYELMLVILLAVTERVEAYELFLGAEAVDDTEPEVEWKRGVGEARDADSRRLYRSLALPTVCKVGPSSPGGEEARLFWPTLAPGEYPSERFE
ncbi:hypothetical protein ACEPPN_008862 [Leptodophora sp. 'Broadleaf-Isolate-01']